jgi:molybdopterin synthase catalytic subunit
MHELADRAFVHFDLMGLLMVHRVGMMRPGEPIVCVSAAALHRRDAIDAVDFCMDHLKSAAWFWKREKRADGWHWIEPREQDHSDLARWQS